jgi:hypothetical protein
LEVVNSTARYNGFFAGRRFGKTHTSKLRIVQRTRKPGFLYWYIAPTYAQASEEFRSLAFEPAFHPLVAHTRQQPYPEIILRNGARIAYRSFDRPDNLRGAGLDEIWVDEIQNIEERDFLPVILPLISDRRGSLVISGQFRGHNWYYDRFYVPGQPGPKSKLPRYRSWALHSKYGVKFQGREGRQELEDLRAAMTRAQYGQEIECIPVENQAAVFRHEDLVAISRGSVLLGAIPGRSYVLGLDLGRIADPTSIIVLECESNAVVYAEKLALGMRHESQALHVATVARRYNAATIVDSTGGATGGRVEHDSYVQFYRQHIPDIREFHWNRTTKQRIIQNLALEIEQHKISVPPVFKDVLDELHAYEYELRSGYYDYHAQSGHHDDHVAALAMACWARRCGWARNPNGLPLSTLVP